MSGVTSAVRLQDILERPDFLRVYLDYERLTLSTLRNLLSDIEATYNRIDRHLNEMSPLRQRGTDSPLLVERIETGHSVVHVLAGSPETLRVFGLLLEAIHSSWKEVAVGGTIIAARGLVDLRNKWLEGEKTRAPK